MTTRNVWRLAGLAGCALLLILIVRYSSDAGVTWDEPFQVEYGERVLKWFTSGFTDRSAMDYENLFVYGGLFDAMAQLIVHRSKAELYVVRHVLTALVAFLGIVAAGATAARISGPRAGVLAGLLLALTPVWIGHGLFNPKDIPFAAAATFVSYAAVRLAVGPSPPRWRDTLLASVAVGIALAVRPGGVFVTAYPFVGAAASLAASRVSADVARPAGGWWWSGAVTTLRLLPLVPIAWTLMIATWPWAQLAPFSRPYLAMEIARHFSWKGVMLFDGANVRSINLPGSYLPTWFWLTTPETYGVALLLGAAALLWKRAAFRPPSVAGFVTVLSAVLIPIAGVIVTRPILYDGLRHFLFLFPIAAILGGLCVDGFLSSRANRWIRSAGIVVLTAACGLVAWDIVSLHPYEYVYFNRLSGGLKAAQGRYETDYWGASYKEGLQWTLKNFVGPHPEHVIPISSCDFGSNPRLRHYREAWTGVEDRISIVDDYREAEVYLGVTRYDCHKRPGVVMHTVSRQGVPLLYVIRIPPR